MRNGSGATGGAAKIPLFRPTIRRRQMHAVLECLVSEEIGPGALARRLVRELAAALQLGGGVALADHGAALTAALQVAAGGPESNGESDQVLMSALAPLEYVHAAQRAGLTPVLVDVDPDSGTLAPDALQRMLAQQPRALVVRHGFGPTEPLEAIREYGVPIVEDVTESVLGIGGGAAAPADHATGTREGAAADGAAPGADTAAAPPAAGQAGTVVVLGLGANDALTAGGGAVVLARGRSRQRLLASYPSAHGWEQLADMNAALALAQWHDLATYRTRCGRLAALFRDALARSRHRTFGPAATAGHLFPVLVADGMRAVRRYATRHHVDTLLAYDGCALTHVMPSGADPSPGAGAGAEPVAGPASALMSLRGAQELAGRCLLFPLYPALSDRSATQVSKVLATLP